MRSLITSLVLFVTVLGFSQSKITKGLVMSETAKIENVSVEVTVDSAKDIESTLRIEDIREILEVSSDNEKLCFRINCNNVENVNGLKSNVSYRIEGSSNDLEAFIAGVDKIRSSAIKYYNKRN